VLSWLGQWAVILDAGGLTARLAPSISATTSVTKVATPMARRQDDTSTNEDRFGRQDREQYSRWSSLLAVVIAVIVVGLVYFFLR
jgi:amino acid transporter